MNQIKISFKTVTHSFLFQTNYFIIPLISDTIKRLVLNKKLTVTV